MDAIHVHIIILHIYVWRRRPLAAETEAEAATNNAVRGRRLRPGWANGRESGRERAQKKKRTEKQGRKLLSENGNCEQRKKRKTKRAEKRKKENNEMAYMLVERR